MAKDKPPAGPTIIVSPKGSTKQISYIWMPDKNGNLVKADASVVKKSFASLPEAAVLALQEFLISVENKTSPTRAQRQTLWNNIIDGAVAAFKNGKKQSPWDVLNTLTKNAPDVTGTTISYTEYDELTSNALLNKIAASLGYDPNLFTPEERTDFFTKLQAEAKLGGKTVTRKAKDGGIEQVTTPSLFDAKAFTESYIWAKATLGDIKNLPTKALTAIQNVKTLLKSYGISNLSDKEISNYGINIASGGLDLTKFKIDLSTQAQKYYPALAKRLADNPDLTVSDIANPIVNILASTWEMDPSVFTLDNPDLDRWLRPDGVKGDAPFPTTAQIYEWAINHPNFEKTTKAKGMAMDSAVGVARAMGFGV